MTPSERDSDARTTKLAADRLVLALLWDAYRVHPSDANRNRLVERYQAFVQELVSRCAARLPRAIDRGDLETAANVGLMAAIAGYDPARGVPFESYCECRVRGALLDELRNEDCLPRLWRQRIEQHRRALDVLRGELGREPRDEEVAQLMGMELDQYELVFGTSLPGAPTRRDQLKDRSVDDRDLEIVEDTRLQSPDDRLSRDELLRLVSQRLSETEYRLVYLRYWEGLGMREIGQMMRLSESRVCKIHGRLIERLKERLRATA